MTFELDKRLENDSVFVSEFELSQVRLMLDKHYPWFLLIPQKNGLVELTDLSSEDYAQLMQESRVLANAITASYSPDKLNFAALGNIVSQLHIHHIARFTTDIAWPNPIWGQVEAAPYTDAEIQAHIEKINNYL